MMQYLINSAPLVIHHQEEWGISMKSTWERAMWEDSITILFMELNSLYKSVYNFRFNSDNLPTWFNAFIMLYKEIWYIILFSVSVCLDRGRETLFKCQHQIMPK